jgi:hypothetical protein
MKKIGWVIKIRIPGAVPANRQLRVSNSNIYSSLKFVVSRLRVLRMHLPLLSSPFKRPSTITFWAGGIGIPASRHVEGYACRWYARYTCKDLNLGGALWAHHFDNLRNGLLVRGGADSNLDGGIEGKGLVHETGHACRQQRGERKSNVAYEKRSPAAT